MADEIITAPVVDRNGLYIATVEGSVLALDRQNGTQLWQEQRNATSAPAVWKDQVYFSRREEVKGGGEEKAIVKQMEMVASRPMRGTGGVRDLPATQHDADYLDYQKRAALKTEVAGQALDGAVGFGTSKGAALMVMAQRNIGQANVHGIWAYQGSKTFIDHGKLYGSMGIALRVLTRSRAE